MCHWQARRRGHLLCSQSLILNMLTPERQMFTNIYTIFTHSRYLQACMSFLEKGGEKNSLFIIIVPKTEGTHALIACAHSIADKPLHSQFFTWCTLQWTIWYAYKPILTQPKMTPRWAIAQTGPPSVSFLYLGVTHIIEGLQRAPLLLSLPIYRATHCSHKLPSTGTHLIRLAL